MKYLITGGAGFIGSNIAHFLIKSGERVRILDNFSTGKRENLVGIEDRIELIDGDIRDFELIKRAVRDIDFVLHLAALASVPISVENPVISNEVNVNGTLNVLEASRLAGVRKVVSSSSSAVYGETAALPIPETTEPRPLSPYAVGKLTAEYYTRLYSDLYKLPAVSLRYFNVYGPRQNPDGDYAAVIPKFILSLLSGERPKVFGDGYQSRDFVYVEDAVIANILATNNNDITGTEFNVAHGARFTLNQLLEALGSIIGTKTAAIYTAPRSGDIRHSGADITKLKAYGYQPKTEFYKGLEKTVEHFTKLYFSEIPVSKLNRW